MARTDLILLVVLAGLIVFAAGLGAAETALVRLSEAKARNLVAARHHARDRVIRLVHERPRALPAVLFAALLVQISAASVASVLATRLFGPAAVVWTAVALTLVMFVYGEVLPKGHAVEHPGPTLTRLAFPVTLLVRALAPVVRAVHAFADLHRRGAREAQPSVTEPELRWLAARAVREGVIDADDRLLMEAAFAAGDRLLGAVMVPRNQIVGVAVDTPADAALELALDRGHRRVVVFEGEVDNALGFVHLADLVRSKSDPAVELAQLLRVPLALPEMCSVVEALREMQRHRTHLALVVDEFGGIAGLVTIEDLVEEVVGSIADEASAPSSGVERIDAKTWLVAGETLLDELSSEVGIDLPRGAWNTVAGLAEGIGGRVLQQGDRVEADGFVLDVVAASARRIEQLELTISGGREGDGS